MCVHEVGRRDFSRLLLSLVWRPEAVKKTLGCSSLRRTNTHDRPSPSSPCGCVPPNRNTGDLHYSSIFLFLISSSVDQENRRLSPLCVPSPATKPPKQQHPLVVAYCRGRNRPTSSPAVVLPERKPPPPSEALVNTAVHHRESTRRSTTSSLDHLGEFLCSYFGLHIFRHCFCISGDHHRRRPPWPWRQ